MAQSPRVQSGRKFVFLDACCLINLFATDRTEEILRSLPYRFAVARYVVDEEVLEIEAESGGVKAGAESSRLPLRPSIDELIRREILGTFDISSPEEERELLRFATKLDDGEAHTCALALARKSRVATDDRKAIRVFRSAWNERHGAGQAEATDCVLRTSELLFPWARGKGIRDSDLARIVRAVARRATFFPPRADPHFERWMDLLRPSV